MFAYMHRIFYVHASLGGHLDWFPVLDIMNGAAIAWPAPTPVAGRLDSFRCCLGGEQLCHWQAFAALGELCTDFHGGFSS